MFGFTCICDRLSAQKGARGQRRKTLARRVEALQAFGGACACCGETRVVMLTIDHIHGGGHQHRQSIPRLKHRPASSQEFYREFREAGYPGHLYQVLCYNCQAAKGPAGVCSCNAAATVDHVAEYLAQGHLPLDHDLSAAGLRCLANNLLGYTPTPVSRNQRDAARVYIKAAARVGDEVPQFIQDMASSTKP